MTAATRIVPDPEQEPSVDGVRGFGRRFLAGVVLAAVLEAGLVAACVLWGLPAWAGLLGHALVTGAVGWAAWRCHRGGLGQEAVGLAMTAVCVGAMGPVGAVGALAMGLLRILFRRDATPVEEWYRTLFPEFEDEEEVRLAARIREGREAATVSTGVAPFIDVLRLGTRDQKEAIIAMLARRFRPEFAPALRLALEDPVPSVRVQAATAAAQINNQVMAESMALTAAAEARPGDPATWRALADHDALCAGLGLMDADQTAAARTRAIGRYARVLELDPGDDAARTAMARLHLDGGAPAAALAMLAPVLDAPPTSLAVLELAADALYRLGRVAELRALLEARAPALPPEHPLALWLGEAAEPLPAAGELVA